MKRLLVGMLIIGLAVSSCGTLDRAMGITYEDANDSSAKSISSNSDTTETGEVIIPGSENHLPPEPPGKGGKW